MLDLPSDMPTFKAKTVMDTMIHKLISTINFVHKIHTEYHIQLCNIYTGCGNIISFLIMRDNQAVEIVAGWACFHSRGEILKFPWKYSQLLSCVGVVRNLRLSSKPTF